MATTPTEYTVRQWFKPLDGKWIDTGIQGTTECVDLSKHWVITRGGKDQGYGDAADMVYGIVHALKGWKYVPPTEQAWPGDVVSWAGGDWGKWGHTAVVVSDEGDTLTVAQQNPKAAHIRSGRTKSGVVGYARPPRVEVEPASAPKVNAEVLANPKPRYKVAGTWMNVRSAPAGEIIGQVPYGTPLVGTGKTENGWVEASSPYQLSKGVTAWYAGDLLERL